MPKLVFFKSKNVKCNCKKCKEKRKKDKEFMKNSKFEKVMKEFKEGKLKSSSGEKITDRQQAIAIAYSESEKN